MFLNLIRKIKLQFVSFNDDSNLVKLDDAVPKSDGYNFVYDNSHFALKKWNYKNYLIAKSSASFKNKNIMLNISPFLIWKKTSVLIYLYGLILLGKRKRVAYVLNSSTYINIKGFCFYDWYVAYTISKNLFNTLDTREALLNLKYEKVLIGDLIYDTYLKDYKKATVELSDRKLLTVITKAIYIYMQCEKNHHFFTDKSRVMLTHSVYVVFGVIARYSIEMGTTTFCIQNTRGAFVKELTRNHPYQTPDFSNYRALFASLSVLEQKEGMMKARGKLESRLQGVVDSSISYMKGSAFSDSSEGLKSLNLVEREFFEDRPYLLIMAHCFFDSPHIYNGMIFEDFYIWIESTLNFCYENRINVLLKPHPNGLDGNDKIFAEIIGRYPWVYVVDKSISNNVFAKEEKIKGCITVYGTIAHELSYIGIPVVNAGDNPHSAYSFCRHPKTEKDYYSEILNVINDTECPAISKDEILEFYYTHYLMGGKGRSLIYNELLDVMPNKGTMYKDILNQLEETNGTLRLQAEVDLVIKDALKLK